MNSLANRLFVPLLSSISLPGAVEYIVSVPSGASSGASPAGERAKAALERIPPRGIDDDDLYLRAFAMHFRQQIASRLNPSRRTSASVQTCALTGSR